MGLLYQKSIRCSVRRQDDGKCVSESVLLATDGEMTARIVFAAEDFRICQAESEVLRTGTCYQAGRQTISGLIGAEAYFGVSEALKRAFPSSGQTLERSLFAECVKGAIQSETYLYKLRGFPDFTAYQAKWELTHPNSCRYYSNLDTVERHWSEYIGDAVRKTDLFSRHKNVSVWRLENGRLRASGSFLDSFHELGIMVELEAEGIITCFDAGFVRAPGRICFESAKQARPFVGQNIDKLTRSFINQGLGGGAGCAHLLDIAQEAFGCLGQMIRI